MTFPITIIEAKQYLKDNFEKGVDCPCCKQFVKLYKRKLNSGMASVLISLYKENLKSPGSYIHVKNFLKENKLHNGHDWTLLKFWHLISEKDQIPGEPNNGLWRISSLGNLFVENKLSVPGRMHFYNGKVVKSSEREIYITEALGEKFNYQELMKTL